MTGWTKGTPKNIDDYLKRIEPERRAALEKLRRQIKSIVPKAEECISYSMPAFRVDKRVVAGFLATKKGCSYYPFSGTTLGTLSEDLASYSQTQSALHFDPARGLPSALLRKLLKARLTESAESRKPTARASAPARRRRKAR